MPEGRKRKRPPSANVDAGMPALRPSPERYRILSPLSHISAKTPPTIMLFGTSDRILPIDQATNLDWALTAHGIAHELYLLPGNDHGFDLNWGGFGTQFAREKVKAFLQKDG